MDSTSSPRTGLNKFYYYIVSAAFTAEFIEASPRTGLNKFYHYIVNAALTNFTGLF